MIPLLPPPSPKNWEREGPGRERATLLACLYNLFQHFFDLLLNLSVSESDHAIAVGLKLFGASLVVFYLLSVGTTIHFNNKPIFGAVEIGDEWP